jgi:hypothetical protein
MAAGAIIQIIGLAIAAGSAVEARKEQRAAVKLQQKQASGKANLERRRMVREARIRRGEIEAQAQSSGTGGGSSASAASSSIGSQLGFNLSQSYATQGLSSDIAGKQQRAQDISAFGQAASSFFLI